MGDRNETSAFDLVARERGVYMEVVDEQGRRQCTKGR
jgi:hypothetical protein